MSVSKKTKDGKFRVRVYLGKVDGKKKYSCDTFDKKLDADKHDRKLKNYKSNNPDQSINDKVLFGEVAKAYLKKATAELKDNTIRSYKSKLKIWINPHLAHFQIGKIDHLTLTRFTENIRTEGINDSSLKVVNVVLDEIFKFASMSLEKYIHENPMVYLPKTITSEKSITRDNYWDEGEATLFLAEAKKTPYFNTFAFFLGTGPRFAEGACVDEQSLDFKNGFVTFGQQLALVDKTDDEKKIFNGPVYFLDTTKSKRSRIVPMNEFVKKVIQDEIKVNTRNRFIFAPGDIEERTVITKRGFKPQTIRARHMTNRTFSYVMERICKSAGVKYIGPHGLRHTFSAIFLMNGGTLHALSKLLGHRNINTTAMYYGHLSNEYMKNASKIMMFGNGI